jgi:hypothetical protein
VSGAFGFTGLLVFVCVAAGCGDIMAQLKAAQEACK